MRNSAIQGRAMLNSSLFGDEYTTGWTGGSVPRRTATAETAARCQAAAKASRGAAFGARSRAVLVADECQVIGVPPAIHRKAAAVALELGHGTDQSIARSR